MHGADSATFDVLGVFAAWRLAVKIWDGLREFPLLHPHGG